MQRPGALRRQRRWSAGIAIIVLQGSCLAPAQRPLLPRPDVRPDVRPTPAAMKIPRPAPAPLVRPAVGIRPATAQAGFSYLGPLVQGGALIGTAPAGATLLTFDGAPVPISADGNFFVAFDRDAGPIATLIATLGDGRTVTRVLSVARRAWNIERLASLPRFSQPTEEFDRLRPAEIAQINAARLINADVQGWRQSFLWPAIGRVSGMFGAQRIYKNGEAGAYHSGTDIAQPAGTPVIAPADGVVILAADHPFTLEGNLLMLDHGMGLNSAFLHLSHIDVKVGERIKRGQQIGTVGMTGRATGPHLHWSLKWRESRIDPILLAGPMPVG